MALGRQRIPTASKRITDVDATAYLQDDGSIYVQVFIADMVIYESMVQSYSKGYDYLTELFPKQLNGDVAVEDISGVECGAEPPAAEDVSIPVEGEDSDPVSVPVVFPADEIAEAVDEATRGTPPADDDDEDDPDEHGSNAGTF